MVKSLSALSMLILFMHFCIKFCNKRMVYRSHPMVEDCIIKFSLIHQIKVNVLEHLLFSALSGKIMRQEVISVRVSFEK